MPLDEFEARRDQAVLDATRGRSCRRWDELIEEFNAHGPASTVGGVTGRRRPPAGRSRRRRAVETGLVCAGCGALAPGRPPVHAALPEPPAGRRHRPRPGPRGIDLRPARPRRRTRTRTRSSATARCSTPTTSPGPPAGATPRYVDLVRELDDAVARWTATASGSRRSRGRPRSPDAAGLLGAAADGLGQGRDRQRGRLAQGAPPVRDHCWSCGWPRPLGRRRPGAPRSPSPAAATRPWPPPSSPAPPAASCASSSRPTPTPPSSTRLRDLGARVVTCPRAARRGGRPDVPRLLRGDRGGRRPVHLPGQPDNGLAIEGGATLGLGDGRRAVGAAGRPARLDRIVVQVGGGACSRPRSPAYGTAAHALPRIDTVQPATRPPAAPAPSSASRARVAAGEAPDVRPGRCRAATARATCGRGRRSRTASPTASSTTRPTTGWPSSRACWRPAAGRSSSTRRPSRTPTRSPARRPASTPTTPARPASPASWPSSGRGAVGPDETVAVIFTGAVRRPPTPAPGDRPVTRAAHRRLHSHHATSGGIR